MRERAGKNLFAKREHRELFVEFSRRGRARRTLGIFPLEFFRGAWKKAQAGLRKSHIYLNIHRGWRGS